MNLHLAENDLLREVFELGEKLTPLTKPLQQQSRFHRVSSNDEPSQVFSRTTPSVLFVTSDCQGHLVDFDALASRGKNLHKLDRNIYVIIPFTNSNCKNNVVKVHLGHLQLLLQHQHYHRLVSDSCYLRYKVNMQTELNSTAVKTTVQYS